MIPDGWTLYSFGDIVVKSQYGLSIPSSLDGQYYIFKMNNFKNGKMNPRKVDKVNLSDADLEKFMLKHGDILINRTNSIDLVGKTGVFDLEGVFTFASYLVRFEVNRTIANPFFINFFFNWSESQQRLKEIATLGVSQANINPTALQKYFKILLPPLLEQCKIAEVLGVWDESIDLLERLIGRVRSRKQGLMQQLLTGKKRFKEFNYSKEDWEKVSFDNCVSSMTSGLSRKLSTQDIGIPVLRSSNIGEKYANFEDLKYWYLDDPQRANTKNYILDDGDILINFINSISQIGKACIFKNCLDRDCIYTTNVLRIKPNTRISSDFFYLVTQTEQYRLYIQSITKPAINQASFTTKELKEFTFLLPPIPEQEKIAAVLSAADEEISTLEKQLAAYKQQKLGLMQQLLTGKIRVGMI